MYLWTFIAVSVLTVIKGAWYSPHIRNLYSNEFFFENNTDVSVIQKNGSVAHVHRHEHYIDEPENYHDCEDAFGLGLVAEELANLRSVFVIFGLVIGLGLKQVGIYTIGLIVGLQILLMLALDGYVRWIEWSAEVIIARRNSRFSFLSAQ